MNTKIAPSILAADFAQLEAEVQAVTTAGADWLHLDVMDGHFVSNLTFGAPIIKALRPYTPLPFDAHLMVTNPEALIPAMLDAGADHITFHRELNIDHMALLTHIRNQGKKAGLSLKPNTNPEELAPFLPYLDLVLVMTVEPGFGGQAYRPEVATKIGELKKMTANLQHPPLLVADGGITPKTAPHAAQLGADCLVAGSAIFGKSLPSAHWQKKQIDAKIYQEHIAALRSEG